MSVFLRRRSVVNIETKGQWVGAAIIAVVFAYFVGVVITHLLEEGNRERARLEKLCIENNGVFESYSSGRRTGYICIQKKGSISAD